MEKLKRHEPYTLLDLLLETGAYPSISQVRKAMQQNALRYWSGGKKVAITEADLKRDPEEFAQNWVNAFTVLTGKATGLLVRYQMNDTIAFERAW